MHTFLFYIAVFILTLLYLTLIVPKLIPWPKGSAKEGKISVIKSMYKNAWILPSITFLSFGLFAGWQTERLDDVQKAVGEGVFNERVKGVEFLFDQFNDIYFDLARPDKVKNTNIHIDSLYEEVMISHGRYFVEATLYISKLDNHDDQAIVSFEYGRLIKETEDTELNIYWNREEKKYQISERSINTRPKSLKSKIVMLVDVKLSKEVFDAYGKCKLSIIYSIPKPDPLEPIYYWYIDPRDYGHTGSLNYSLHLSFSNFTISDPEIYVFDLQSKVIKWPCEKKLEDIIEYNTFKSEFSLATKKEGEFINPIILVFKYTGIPDELKYSYFDKYHN